MTRQHTERRTVKPFTMSPFLALVALAMTLLGFFAIHSEVTGHDMHSSAPVSAESAVSLGSAAASAAVIVVAADLAVMSASSHEGALDCALLALACVLLLVVVSVVVFTRRPAVYQRLLDAGGPVGLIRAAAVYIHRPSLTLLSISRV
jgi:hypothetical protein